MATRVTRAVAQYMASEWSSGALGMARIVFGMMMTIGCIRFISLGWIHEQYVAPVMHFPYWGFEWVTPLPEMGMYAVFTCMTLAAVGIMLGLYYRQASILFFLSFTYIELIDKTYYLNHYYFVSLIALLLCFLPTNTTLSLDVVRRPSIRRDVVPRWTVDILKFQIAIVYVFAGLAKINADWLLHAMPLAIWMPAHDDLPLIGSFMQIPWVPYAFSWMGMLFDCTVPFFLMNRRTRIPAYAAVVVFHTVTGLMFQIGMFPLVMIGMTLIFFADNKGHETRRVAAAMFVPKYKAVAVTLALFVLVQVLLPLRFMLYSGNVYWSEQGYRFAWRVMLIEKAGSATFYVRDGNGSEGMVLNADFLNAHQEKQMAMQPDMVLQYAHYLRDHYKAKGMATPRVRAEVWVTLNGRPSELLVDPQADLASEREGLHDYAWVRTHE